MTVLSAKNYAEEIIKDKNLKGLPIDIEALAKQYNLQIVYQELVGGVSGMLVSSSGSSYCFVNESDSLARKRFTIAHELGHFLLEHQKQSGEHVHVDRGNLISLRSNLASQGVDKYEIEANQFAACILMPEELIKNELELMGHPETQLTDDKVDLLSDKFQVSQQAMTIRLANLKLI